MNSEIKAEWITALRSGEYAQGQSSLRDEDDQFCCLGVLCDIAVKRGHGIWQQTGESGNTFAFVAPDGSGSSAFLPTFLADLFNLSSYGVIDNDNGHFDLINMNDSGMPFGKIADVIENQL